MTALACKSGIDVSRPDLAERLNALRCHFDDIGNQWDDRVQVTEFGDFQRYFEGRFSIVSKLRIFAGDIEYMAYAVTYCVPSAFYGGPSSGGMQTPVLRHFGNPDDGDKHVVLLPIVEFIQDSEIPIPSGSVVVMRFYPAHQRILHFQCGLPFKNMTNGLYETLLVGLDWHGRFLRPWSINGSPDPHITGVKCRAEVAADIANQARDAKGPSVGGSLCR